MRRRLRWVLTAAWLASGLAGVSGCYRIHERTPRMDATVDGPAMESGVDARDARDVRVAPDTAIELAPFCRFVPRFARVDVLFVVDDSRSMAEEQAFVAEAAPEFVRGLVTGDVDGNGRIDFATTDDLRLGVITTDITSRRGELRTSTHCSVDGAIEWRMGQPTTDATDPFACLVREIGINGSGDEHPVQAVIDVLERQGRTGFPRANALFVVVIVTDEDDPGGNLFPEFVRYRSADTTAVAAIAGVGVGSGIIANPTPPFRWGHSITGGCRSAHGNASAPTNLASFAVEFGARAALQSICADDFGEALAQIGRLIGETRCGLRP